MLPFWQTIDCFGKLGAPRASWQIALGGDFPAGSDLLRACDTVDSIEDPDFPGEILDLEETDTGDFLGFSGAIPSHRPPILLERQLCVRLVPDLRALAHLLGTKLGFSPDPSPRWDGSCFHEIGTFTSERDNPRSVYLFIPDARPRQLTMTAGICGVGAGIVLLPTHGGFTREVVALAAGHDVHVRVLTAPSGMEKLSIAPPRRSPRGSGKTTRTPIFTPKDGWQWKELTIAIERDGLRFRIRGEECFQTWTQLKMKPIMGGRRNNTLDLLGRLARGERITQRRNDVTARQQVSVARKFLKELIPIGDNPFKEFSDGWGIEFQMDGTASRKQVAEWESEDDDEEFSLDRHAAGIDPEDMAGYSVHKF
jgi:hypothetical protein